MSDANDQTSHGRSILLKDSNAKVADVVTVAAYLAQQRVYPSAAVAIAEMVRTSPKFIETATKLGLLGH